MPTNPFDSGSGTGARTEGPYELTLSFEFAEDVDVYRVDMRPGDVLGAARHRAAVASGAVRPGRHAGDGFGPRPRRDFYPDDSPLRVAGNATLDHVAAVDGPHFLRVSRGAGEYQLDLRVRRPGLESDAPGGRQILFLDFDGAFVDPSTFGTDSGELSPLADFLGRLGPRPADEDALIDSIVATFAENLSDDPHGAWRQRAASTSRSATAATTPTRAASRTSAASSSAAPASSSASTPSASRRVGRPRQLRHGRRPAVVLLDQASAPAGSGLRTINDFVTPDTDMVALVGRSLGFVASHEAGHLLGNWHTQPNNGVVSIMDTFDITQLGLGPDFVFGTADDVDVDFVVDQLIEGHIGAEDTMTRTAWALSTPVPPRR